MRMWQGTKIFIKTWEPIANFTSLLSTVDLPSEYLRAIKFNGAVELAPEYNTSITGEVAAVAVESYKILKKLHAQPVARIRTNMIGASQQRGSKYIVSGDTFGP